ncbi:MAG: hypothetical protein H6860_03520 [Rhodospirillales bacterium]|nr:hypothetical protein [Alphaproteobacteria bacterium]MCB9981448.1 hypothetical protein [Rhodospirillales bacterium]HOO82388.1 hypothetical protein [Alphaproteobacteria bacterium]
MIFSISLKGSNAPVIAGGDIGILGRLVTTFVATFFTAGLAADFAAVFFTLALAVFFTVVFFATVFFADLFDTVFSAGDFFTAITIYPSLFYASAV